ncbi:hypothetical protein [Membranihabitans maritimus]|uniref:hypothetical protein n=1 Tax=Membranihabitans maritimus TaxID=2904244 RepID=UPI001F3ADB49|nr:hypothetical protein [Membranihabitans maritimus]
MNFDDTFYSDSIYHIWSHANGTENLFREVKNYNFFKDKYWKFIGPIAHTFGYCLLPNHFHLLIKTKSLKEMNHNIKNISFEESNVNQHMRQKFSNLLNSYTKSYNRLYKRKGSLFIPRFKRKLIDTEEYFTKIILYIHSNPVHHHLVKSIDDWAYSSWYAYAYDKEDIVYKEEVLKWFGGKNFLVKAHQDININYENFYTT